MGVKLLLVPIFTSRIISKCSTYYALKQQGLAFLRGGDDRFVYCVIPKRGEHGWEVDDVVEHPRWSNVEVRFLTGDRYQNMLFPPEDLLQFTNWGTHWDWDVLVTTMNNGWVWRIFSQARPAVDDQFPRFLLLIDAFPMLTFKKTLSWKEERDVQFLSSYLAFDQVTIQSEHEKRGMLGAARRMLSPSSVQSLMERLTVTYPLPSVDLTMAESRTVDDARPLRVVYPQRLDLFERRRDEMLDVLRGAFRLSTDIEVVVSTNSNIRSLSDHDHAFIDFQRPDRAGFYALLKTCDVSLSWSREEGIPYSLLEATAHGAIPIAKREPWSEEFYGKDYWGLAKSEADAVAKIKWIAAHRKETRRQFLRWYVDVFRPHLLQAADLDARQEAWVTAHMDRLRSRLKENAGSLAAMLDKAPIARVDMNDDKAMGKLDGIRLKEDKRPMQPPISRRRDVYVDRLRLVHWYGWKDTIEPGVLVRQEVQNGDRRDDSGASADEGRVLREVEASQGVEPEVRAGEQPAVVGEEVQPRQP